MLWEKVTDDTEKWKDMLCSWTGKIKIVKTFLLHEVIYGFNVMPMKIPGLSWWLSGKEPSCCKEMWVQPLTGKIPWRRK